MKNTKNTNEKFEENTDKFRKTYLFFKNLYSKGKIMIGKEK